MVRTRRIPAETRAYVKLLRRHMNMSYRQIGKECNIATSSAFQIMKVDTVHHGKHRKRPGRPRKITPVMERHVLRQLKKLRLLEGSFTVPRLLQVCGLNEQNISQRTLLNLLHRHGYRFRQTRKKGLLTTEDLKKRVAFAKKMLKRPSSFWCDGVAFYLDAVSFAHKTNPLDQAKAPTSRIYRLKGEGLDFGCTTRGKKEGTGGHYVRLIVAISHGKGVILCEPYEKMTGAFFANFIKEHFPRMFNVADKDHVFIQDNDPSQSSVIAREAMKEVNAQLLTIPPRSPDINPIENFFHVVSQKLRSDALLHRYTKETLAEFEARVIRTMMNIPLETINNTIASLSTRLREIVTRHGQRVKY